MDVFNTLKELNSCFGPSGCEDEVREKIAGIAAPFADEIRTDTMGNLIVLKKAAPKGKSGEAYGNAAVSGQQEAPRLMFAAHMDSLGMIVTYIEDSGLLRFGAVGYVLAENVVACPVRFANGTAGTVGMDEDSTKPEIDKMFIDIGASSRKEAEKLVKCGDIAIYDTPCRMLGARDKASGSGKGASGRIVSPYTDNRAGCVAQLVALEKLKKPVFDCYFVFTVQEEVGRRGAKPAAFGIDPQYGIVCDCTLTDDIPWTRHVGTSKVGGGASIKVMDKSVICHPEMVASLKTIAAKKKIPFQTDVLTWGGTDGNEIRKNASGVFTGGVSVPCRYVHTPQEVCSASDIEAVGRLMAAFAETKPEF